MSVSVDTPYALDYDWLRDDSEDDVVGADWHQDAIRALSTSSKMLADEQGWPWHVGDQLTVVCDKPDATEWRPCPDVSIHPRLGPEQRRDIDVRVDGPPSLVIEVASRSTWTYDVSQEVTRRGKRQAGKAYGYLALMRVPEYLVFDPYGEFLGGQVRAWRRVGDGIEEWQPGVDGRYNSPALGVSFRPDGPLLRIFDPDGRPVPYWFEARRENAALQQRIADLEAELQRSKRRGAST